MIGTKTHPCGGFFIEGRRQLYTATAGLVGDRDPAVQRYWIQGPTGNIIKTAPITRRTFDGIEMESSWTYLVHLASTPLGVDPVATKQRLRSYWQSSKGWIRAGKWIQFTSDSEIANCTLKLVEDDDVTLCRVGTSCARRENGHDTIGIRRTHLALGPYVPNHEINHGTDVACDMYNDPTRDVVPGSYWGIMDNGAEQSSWPRDRDIRFSKIWLRGEAVYIGC